MVSVCFTISVTVTVLSLFCVELILFLNDMTFRVVTVTVRVTVFSIFTDVSFNRFDEGLKDILRRNKFYVHACMRAYERWRDVPYKGGYFYNVVIIKGILIYINVIYINNFRNYIYMSSSKILC